MVTNLTLVLTTWLLAQDVPRKNRSPDTHFLLLFFLCTLLDSSWSSNGPNEVGTEISLKLEFIFNVCSYYVLNVCFNFGTRSHQSPDEILQKGASVFYASMAV